MQLRTREEYKLIQSIIPEQVCSTSASSINTVINAASTLYSIGENFSCLLSCSSGKIYFNSLTTAPTTANSYWIKEGQSQTLMVSNTLALIGDSTTSKFQAIIWK